ncbi:translocation/assembly module TamB domain-containing protein [Rhodoferax sp.]|uniref:translocation/assembly module TamB domain-containing protein n=1 Tax=Rhodoferax sp. TaxID=50421 RepID=UPI002717E108|nr:translocation/assembly module TamB domain-containing protein [Rhodoferax sp.]MDO9145124.1 translocation/assembly module TamB domain-containing protein [Rhodoferax sp.]MDP3864529.1 translocation/assembly module TamB domain-containing protein [Rhodoferax sp.]
MRAMRLGLKLLAATLIGVLALTAALWLWSASDSSLATLLTRLQRFLPAGQTLEAKDVRGSLRAGGHIGWLRWQQGDLTVEAQDIGVAWTLAPLFNKQVRLGELSVASLSIVDQRNRADTPPLTPPTDLRLPITLEVPFKVASLSWTGATTLQATELSGIYHYDGQAHALEQGRGRVASGSYQLSGQLQAMAPMALALQAQGLVQTTLPSSQQPLTVAATAQLMGQLVGPDAVLALHASLKPVATAGATVQPKPSEVMQAEVSAQLAPWHVQPIVRGQAQWRGLNLAALWPQAPRTQLSGDASVTPDGQAWQGRLTLANARPGPWNQQRLPLNSLQADLRYDQAQWTLQSLQAKAAGGNVTGSGDLTDGLWQGDARLHQINPGAIDTRLASSALSGKLQARQSPAGIAFEAQLAAAPAQGKARPAPTSLDTLRLQGLQAQGLWASPQLTLGALSIDAQDAHLEGNLAYHLNTQAAQGKLAFKLPGLQGSVDGHLASQAGQGTLAVKVTDVSLTSQWLKRWAVVDDALQGLTLRGAAQLDGSWQGGWQQQGRGLQIDARLRAPQLSWRSNPSTPGAASGAGQLQGLELDLAGTLPALNLRTQGRADIGVQQLSWQAQAKAGRLTAGHWQGSVGQLKLVTQDNKQPGSWTLQADTDKGQAVVLDWLASRLENTLTLSAGSARLTGPYAGEARMNWQAARWSQALARTAKQTQPKAQWHSQGQISQLPLAWLDALSGKTMADLGLSSDLILAGRWDAKHTDAVHLSAMLERSSGDLRLRVDDSRQTALPADMREARLELNLDAGYLSSSLRWDSLRAGKALMAFSTQLQPMGHGWNLDQQVPIGGSLKIQLPPVDAWSVLAPPGWRLRGTMDADITLTGTLAAPLWDGQIQARDLAVRSVVDGIDFSQGRLNARLHGQQMDIKEFSLQGAATSAGSGGQVAVTGSVFWLPAGSETDFLSRLSMSLDVQAKALRLSNRSDRRVVVSGKVAAQLRDARLSLRGNLAVDQALITLPDDSAPQLGDDVLVRRPAATQSATTTPAKNTLATRNASAPRLVTDLLIEIDLGRDFQVRGRGLDTRLAGKLSLHAVDRERPNLTGTVRTMRGTYRAYGQRLDIEQGLVHFVGSADNPMLDILAIRPQLSQRVGVQVSGTALSPIVRLYAEPDLPEAEKLAWLVLGRSASGSGGEAALLQQAALALLGGSGRGPSASLTQALGLDELSFSGSNGGNTASGATVTIGKRLSKDFYVAYESGLAGTMGVFTIFYDLSRRLTLRARTGEQSAIDLIWTLRYD